MSDQPDGAPLPLAGAAVLAGVALLLALPIIALVAVLAPPGMIRDTARALCRPLAVLGLVWALLRALGSLALLLRQRAREGRAVLRA